MNFVFKMDFDSFKPEFQYLSAPFLVSCLLQHPLPGLVSHVHVSLQMTAVVLSIQITD